MLAIAAAWLTVSEAAAMSFSGSFEFQWLNAPGNQHREMKLLSQVSFTDKAGKEWVVPAGAVVDGASIPPVLWSFAGSPFVGNYRRPSVVHDHFCDLHTLPASEVHKMFLDAMEADGVGLLERITKYAAVSAYSVVGGQCGLREDPLVALAERQDFQTFRKTDELNVYIRSLQAPGGRRSDIETRAQVIESLAEVENPRTFNALTAFRRVPSEENYRSLEVAISTEQPDETELDELILLANAAVPEGSIELDVQ